MNLTAYAPKHYVHIALIADWESGEPQLLEPEKAESWDWHQLDRLPHPLFGTCQLAVDEYKAAAHRNYFDARNR